MVHKIVLDLCKCKFALTSVRGGVRSATLFCNISHACSNTALVSSVNICSRMDFGGGKHYPPGYRNIKCSNGGITESAESAVLFCSSHKICHQLDIVGDCEAFLCNGRVLTLTFDWLQFIQVDNFNTNPSDCRSGGSQEFD